MKYWWTLGSFPTGLDVPFRLNEFLTTYKQQHVPLEVEEWLTCFLHEPVEVLQDAASVLLSLLEECPVPESRRGYVVPELPITRLLEPLKKFEEQLGIKIPPVAIRAANGHKALRERLMDDFFDYRESIRTNGSTPHRRLARAALDEPQLEQPQSCAETVCLPNDAAISPELGDAVGVFSSVSQSTADDELKLIRLMTTLAEGCALKERYDDAYSILSSSLLFAHDESSQSAIHSNASVASLLDGHFDDAAYHGREAALLISAPKKAEKLAARGYQLWATAVAYQDDYDRAQSILNDALLLLPEAVELTTAREKLSSLHSLRAAKTHPSVRRSHLLKSQQTRGILNGSGTSFDNEFDWVVFKNKLYPAKMNPSSNEMGSVFRRVGDLGGAISTSRSTELL